MAAPTPSFNWGRFASKPKKSSKAKGGKKEPSSKKSNAWRAYTRK